MCCLISSYYLTTNYTYSFHSCNEPSILLFDIARQPVFFKYKGVCWFWSMSLVLKKTKYCSLRVKLKCADTCKYMVNMQKTHAV